ncbi:interleukin-6-like [Pungitius pungitius]|uniref:interleukin-6-like n=1 Tax=Pungitius pungitius TaxID=134920 RepID=UPI002E10ECB3
MPQRMLDADVEFDLLLSAVTLAALLPHAPGAPVEETPTAAPAVETSGEEVEVEVVGVVVPSGRLSDSPLWPAVLGVTNLHKKEFEEEFKNVVEYNVLDDHKVLSVPESCPRSNFSEEACLHRIAHGLLIYTVLLKHVEKEYPGSLIGSLAKYYSGLLINLCKEKMRKPVQVAALTGSQEAQLLRGLDQTTAFQRKMVAHSILRQLHHFLLDNRRAIAKWEKRRKGSVGSFQIL